MRFKKVLAGVAAGAMVVSTLALPTFADGTVEGTITYDVSNGWFDSSDEWGQVWLQAWGGTVTVESAYVTLTDGTTVDAAYDSSNTITMIGTDDEGNNTAVVDDYSAVASVTYVVAYDADEYNDDETWIGGGIGTNSTSTGWLSVEWGKASGEKPIAIEDYVVTDDEEVAETVETVVEAMGVSYNTAATVSSADYADADYTSATIHIDGLNYNDSTVDAYWNDWCQIYVAVTVDDVTTYYVVAGASASWDATVDDNGTDDDSDDVKVLTTDENFIIIDTTDGTDITVDLTGDAWSIEVVALGWDGAPDTAYAQASVTLTGVSASTETVDTVSGNDDADTTDDTVSDNDADDTDTADDTVSGSDADDADTTDATVSGNDADDTDTADDTASDNDTDDTDTTDTVDYVLGDINADGVIDYLDAMEALRADAELITLDETQALAGDVNGDGVVDSLDAILILRYDAGLITSF